MIGFLSRPFSTPISPGARNIQSSFLAVASLLVGIVLLLSGGGAIGSLASGVGFDVEVRLALGFIGAVGSALAYWFNRRGDFATGRFIMLGWMLAALVITTVADVVGFYVLLGFLVALIAGIITRGFWTIVIQGATVLAGMVFASRVGDLFNDPVANDAFLTLFGTIFGIMIVAAASQLLLFYIIRETYQAEQTVETQRRIGGIGVRIATIRTRAELLPLTVDQIREQLGYYHAQVFLTNPTTGYADLVASTGVAGRQLLERSHRIQVGSQSVIGRVTLAGQPVVANARDREGIHAFNELLPNTKAELALPLMDGERVVGALDIQSAEADAFPPAVVASLQVLANQLATALRNTDMYDEQVRATEENRQLASRTTQSLAQIERLNQRLGQAAWQAFTAESGAATGIARSGAQVLPSQEWTPRMIAAVAQRATVVDQPPGGDTLVAAVPLMIRGEALGALEIEIAAESRPSEIESLMRTLATQLATSLENARLYEEAQSAAVQEKWLNQISGRYQTAGSVDEVVRLTLAELSDALGARGARIRLGGMGQAGPANGTPAADGHSGRDA
jgi:GAF domain-containing protein